MIKHFEPTEETEKKAHVAWDRVLVVPTRGITCEQRYLMQDIITLLPHHKKEIKFDNKHNLSEIAEICELRNCSRCLVFESRKHTDLYLWAALAPNGPSLKFHVENSHAAAGLTRSLDDAEPEAERQRAEGLAAGAELQPGV